jgi:hypothetical protein
MTFNAVPVHCCLEAWFVMMIVFGIISLDRGGRKRVNQMTSPARYYCSRAAVTVTPDAVWILQQRSSRMMVAIGTFLGQFDVLCMVEIERFK